jgi:hypothetical protein
MKRPSITVTVNCERLLYWGTREAVSIFHLPPPIRAALCTPGTYKITLLRSRGLLLPLCAKEYNWYPILHRHNGPPQFCKDFACFVGFKVRGHARNWNITPSSLTAHLRITLVKPL